MICSVQNAEQIRTGMFSNSIMPMANHNSNAPRQGYAQTVPVLNTTKKKSYGGLIAVLVMILFITSIVGGLLIFGIGGVKAEEMSGIWSIDLPYRYEG